jgi:hypothetical protein
MLLLPLAAACSITVPKSLTLGTGGHGDGTDTTDDSSSSSSSWTSSGSWTSTSSSTTDSGLGGDPTSIEGTWSGLVNCPGYGDGVAALALDLDRQGEGYGLLEFLSYDTGGATVYYYIGFDASVSPDRAEPGDKHVPLTVTPSNCALSYPYAADVYCETFANVDWAVDQEQITGDLKNFLQLGVTCDFELAPY